MMDERNCTQRRQESPHLIVYQFFFPVSLYPLMEDLQISNGFFYRYVSYLLPALMRLNNERTCEESSNGEQWIKVVRLEVDMALVISTRGRYRWRHALKCRLEKRMSWRPFQGLQQSQMIQGFSWLPNCPRPLGSLGLVRNSGHHESLCNTGALSSWKPRNKAFRRRRTKSVLQVKRRSEFCRREEEFGCLLNALRGLIPGGNLMGMDELFCEVESYVACLRMQVNILGCLVSAPS
ncbi:uncharacterized protein LOC116251072 [Nymphaea colorata]|nr:uncharacterized protein LOC116251072 [Nymphaea colorata]